MFVKLLKIFISGCNIITNIRSEAPRLEGLHMSQDEHNKQKDISKFLKSQVTGSFLNCPQIAVQSFPKLPCLYRPAVHT